MNFEDFNNHPDPLVVQRAQLLSSITNDFQAGKMTEDEYRELVNDLLDYDKVVELSTDLQRRVEVAEAFKKLYFIAKTLAAFL